MTAPDHASLTKHGWARYVVTLEPLPNVDGIKSLRFVLKNALRRHGMKCVDLAMAEGHQDELGPTPLIQSSDETSPPLAPVEGPCVISEVPKPRS
jgi:hypothetical protein